MRKVRLGAGCRPIGALLAILSIWLLPSPQSNVFAQEISDIEVTDAVEEELLLDPAIPFDRIDVQTKQGIVLLSGQVHNLLAKERSAKIAETVRGVRSVVNQIRVLPVPSLSVDWISTSVEAAWMADPAAEHYDVAVDVRDEGAIVLTGIVQSWQERHLAETVAKGVLGVTAVINEIEVEQVATRPDKEIEREVEQRLRWDALVDHSSVAVHVMEGNVMLGGTVGSAAEKRRAKLDAWVAGVESVDDTELQVARWARDEDLRTGKHVVKPNDEIRRAVQDALVYDPQVSSFDIDVQVLGGVVTLYGVVDNPKAKAAAELDARHTVGVNSVRNRLKVRPVAQRDDTTIAADVREALRRDPYIERYEITPSVTDQIVFLYGTVDSYFERAQVEDVASRIRGVVGVRNHLEVRRGQAIYASRPYVDTWETYDYPVYDDRVHVTALETDAEIEASIEDQIVWSPFVDADDLQVSVDEGVATLTGRVTSRAEQRAATQNAFEGGALRVRNELVVGAPQSGWRDFVAEFGISLVVALIMTLLFVLALRWAGPWPAGPRDGVLVLLLVLLLSTWVGGLWLTSFGPLLWGVPWLSFLAIGAFVALLVASTSTRRPGEPLWSATAATASPFPLNPFFWVMVVGLVAALLVYYVT